MDRDGKLSLTELSQYAQQVGTLAVHVRQHVLGDVDQKVSREESGLSPWPEFTYSNVPSLVACAQADSHFDDVLELLCNVAPATRTLAESFNTSAPAPSQPQAAATRVAA